MKAETVSIVHVVNGLVEKIYTYNKSELKLMQGKFLELCKGVDFTKFNRHVPDDLLEDGTFVSGATTLNITWSERDLNTSRPENSYNEELTKLVEKRIWNIFKEVSPENKNNINKAMKIGLIRVYGNKNDSEIPVVFYTSRPGMIIGKSGRVLDFCQKYLEFLLEHKVKVEIVELKDYYYK